MVKKLTPDEVVSRCLTVHGERYEYRIDTFRSTSVPMTIICKDHGPFSQTPSNHFKGKGCPRCAKVAPYTTESFIEQACRAHSDAYTYGKATYAKSTERLTITCPKHGDFLQTPASHLAGAGCPSCGGTKKLTQVDFVARATEVHGDAYDFSRAVYVNNRSPVEVVCPEHGSFFPSPSNLFAGKGCNKCAGNIRLSTAEFIEKAVKIHGSYSYDNVEYVDAKSKVAITCPDHGVFWQTPNAHLNGHGCPACKREKISAKMRKSHDDFMSECVATHGPKFDYRYTVYVDDLQKIVIGCKPTGTFSSRPVSTLLDMVALRAPIRARQKAK